MRVQNQPIKRSLVFHLVWTLVGACTHAWATELRYGTLEAEIRSDTTLDSRFTNQIAIFGDAVVDLAPGEELVSGVQLFESSDLRVSDGSILQGVRLTDESRLGSSNGSITGVRLEGASTGEISGGDIHGWVTTWDSSTLHILGGRFEGVLVSHGSSGISFSGGEMGLFNAYDASKVQVSGGSFSSYFSVNDNVTANVADGSFATPSYRANGSSWSKITAGEIGSLRASDSSILQLAGSTMADYVVAENSASVFISGGVADGLSVGSAVHWSGGRLSGRISVYDTLSVYGANLELRDHRLTGTLADGTDIDVLLDVREQGRVNLLGSELVPVPPPAPNVVTQPRVQQPPWRPEVVTSAQAFLSDARTSTSGGPPENPVLVHNTPNESGSLYVWMEPDAAETLIGVDLVAAAATPGVVQFTDATVLNPAVTVPGLGLELPRWEHTGGRLIEEYPVSGLSFNGFNVMKGTGLTAATTADDSGAVLFARVDYEVLGEGATDVYLMIGDKGISPKGRSSVEIEVLFGADETGVPLNGEYDRMSRSLVADATIVVTGSGFVVVPEPCALVLALVGVIAILFRGYMPSQGFGRLVRSTGRFSAE